MFLAYISPLLIDVIKLDHEHNLTSERKKNLNKPEGKNSQPYSPQYNKELTSPAIDNGIAKTQIQTSSLFTSSICSDTGVPENLHTPPNSITKNKCLIICDNKIKLDLNNIFIESDGRASNTVKLSWSNKSGTNSIHNKTYKVNESPIKILDNCSISLATTGNGGGVLYATFNEINSSYR